ncbi:MAG: hypothetical protein AAF337_15310 [Pseudomonadota bacterium]
MAGFLLWFMLSLLGLVFMGLMAVLPARLGAASGLLGGVLLAVALHAQGTAAL